MFTLNVPLIRTKSIQIHILCYNVGLPGGFYMIRKNLKRESREVLKHTCKNLLPLFFIFFAFMIVVSIISAVLTGLFMTEETLEKGYVVYELFITAIAVISGIIFKHVFTCILIKAPMEKTSFKELIEITQPFKNIGNVIFNYFVMFVFIILWTLLFYIPGFIAIYRYRMLPYILAQNPEMKALETLKLSKKIMIGRKFDLYVLELSFSGIYMLMLLPFYLILILEFLFTGNMVMILVIMVMVALLICITIASVYVELTVYNFYKRVSVEDKELS